MQSVPPPSSRPHAYVLSAALCSAALLLPFLLVEIPPITDLPQQTAQMRLLFEAMGDGQGTPPTLRVQAVDPNKLGYLPLLVGWLLLPPLAAGRLAVAAMGLLWVVSIHALAHSTRRSPASAAIASLFFFNHTMYWGLLNFLVGLPVYCLFWLRVRLLPREQVSRGSMLQLTVLLLLLYSAHVLWFAAGMGFLLLAALAKRFPPATLATVLPSLALVAWWYPRFAASGFVSETTWGLSPLGRLHPDWLLNSGLGGLRGNGEGLVALALLLWLGLGLGQHLWRSRREAGTSGIDRGLLATAALFLLAALTLPGVVQHTIFFASRWLPVAAVCLVLALPPPRLRPLLHVAFPLLLWAGLMTATLTAWTEFEHQELEGLHSGLATIPAESRVLGLDFVRTSEVIQGFPFYHLYAWSQALEGAELAHSFANEASSLVVFTDLPRRFPWTEGLDWQARKVRRSDIPHFDFVLVHAAPEVHSVFLADERLVPATPTARWRLYRVRDVGPHPAKN